MRGHEKAQPVNKNADLWARIADLTGRYHISAEWAKTGSTLERQIQREALKPELPSATGYEAAGNRPLATGET